MRTYVADLPGGTATTAVQMTDSGSISRFLLSIHDAAVGKTEISTSSSPQIGTGQPTKEVLARINHSATAGDQDFQIELVTKLKVKPLDYIYIHQTGTGNVGNVTIL